MLVALFLIFLVGCKTYELGPEWKPLTTVIERPTLPFISDTATTTKGSHVYTTDLDAWLTKYPPGSVEFAALMMHEREHARRQFRYKDLPGEAALIVWIARYVSDAEFMWAEEQQGHYLAIKHLQANGLWTAQHTAAKARILSRYRTLSGNAMVSEQEATVWIEQALSGDWSP